MTLRPVSLPCSFTLLGLLPQGAVDHGQLWRGVVVEGDGAGEAGAQAGVAVQEAVYLPGVAGDDDAEPAAVVLHQLEQGIHRLPPKVVAATTRTGADEAVGLVDEQHAIESQGDGVAYGGPVPTRQFQRPVWPASEFASLHQSMVDCTSPSRAPHTS